MTPSTTSPMNKPNCCEKCANSYPQGTEPACWNVSCECHLEYLLTANGLL